MLIQLFIMLSLGLGLSAPLAWAQDNLRMAFTPAEQCYLQQHPILRASNENDYPPLDFAIDGQPQGYSIDLLNLLATRIGVKVEYVNGYTWAQLVELFKTQQLDLLHSLAKTPERETFGLYSAPYRRTPISYITHKANPDITDIRQLNGKIVAIGEGWSTQEYLVRHHPQIKLLAVNGSEAMLDTVARGKAYATIEFSDAARYLIKAKGMRELKLAGWFKESDQWEGQRFYFLTQKDAPELISLLNRALASLTPGEMDVLERKWFGDPESMPEAIPRITLTPTEQAYLARKHTLRICVDPNWMPYEQINAQGVHEGMSADYFALFSQRLGVNFALHPTQTWQETLDAAQARLCDLITLAAETTDRKAYLDFTSPYAAFPYVIATTQEKLFIEDIGKELDKTYVVIQGYVVGGKLRNAYPGIRLEEVHNIREGLERVRAGKAAGYIDASAAIGYAIQRDAMPDLKIAGIIPIDFSLSVATRNDEPILHEIFQKAVTQLSDKEKQRIFNQWIAVRFERGIDYDLIWKILAATTMALLVVLYWNRRLEAARCRTQLALEQLHLLQQSLHEKNQALEYRAVTDQLTGLYNRAQLNTVIVHEIQRACHCTFGIVLIDIDHFKEVNDSYGHPVGDQVLIAIANLIQAHIRVTDTAGRWGGEEFMIVCPETDSEGLIKLAEKLRNAIEQYTFPIVDTKTASFGVTAWKPGDSPKTLVARADTALYQAKHQGRNRVRLA